MQLLLSLTLFAASQESRVTALTSEPLDFSLRWQHRAPEYRGDLDTYIWQNFRKPPSAVYVKIFILNRGEPQNMRVLLQFKNNRILNSFRSRHKALPRPAVSSNLDLPAVELLDTFGIAYNVVLSDMINFLNELSEQTSKLVSLPCIWFVCV